MHFHLQKKKRKNPANVPISIPDRHDLQLINVGSLHKSSNQVKPQNCFHSNSVTLNLIVYISINVALELGPNQILYTLNVVQMSPVQ